MDEKIVIRGFGTLHDKDYGNIKMDTPTVFYDKEIDQYCENGQWEIPFHQEKKKFEK